MSYLYAVQMIIPGYPFAPIKIGVSNVPDTRSLAYRNGPFPTVWLGSWPEDIGNTEREVHLRFDDYRLSGEWFYPSVRLIRFVERKIGCPIQSIMDRRVTGQKEKAHLRFLRLFPDGLESIEKEWEEPGLARPCSNGKYLDAIKELSAIH
jgi:hypothetical protein